MDDLVQEFVKQVPALAVLAFIVIAFLRHLSVREKREETLYEKTLEVVAANSELLGSVKTMLERFNGKQSE